MNWENHIETNPRVMTGKPVIRGTRLTVEHLLGLFAQGWSESQILDSYPGLTREQLQACLQYAAKAVSVEQWADIES